MARRRALEFSPGVNPPRGDVAANEAAPVSPAGLVPAPTRDAAEVLAELHVGGVAAATGTPGSGKTTTVLRALDRVSWGRRAVVFDPYAWRDRQNWTAGHRDRAPWWPNAPLVTLDALLRKPAILDRAERRLVVCGTRATLDAAELGRDFSTLV